MPIVEIPTDHSTAKDGVFPTDGQTLCTSIPDQPFDGSFADQYSVGDADFCRPTSVRNVVMWCSDNKTSPKTKKEINSEILATMQKVLDSTHL